VTLVAVHASLHIIAAVKYLMLFLDDNHYRKWWWWWWHFLMDHDAFYYRWVTY